MSSSWCYFSINKKQIFWNICTRMCDFWNEQVSFIGPRLASGFTKIIFNRNRRRERVNLPPATILQNSRKKQKARINKTLPHAQRGRSTWKMLRKTCQCTNKQFRTKKQPGTLQSRILAVSISQSKSHFEQTHCQVTWQCNNSVASGVLTYAWKRSCYY